MAKQRYSMKAGIPLVIAVLFALMIGRTVAQPAPDWTLEFPGAGTKNQNGYIGPFCCTGETAEIKDGTGNTLGFVYFYSFTGARNFGNDGSVAASVSLLFSAGSTMNPFPATRFDAASWRPHQTRTVRVGKLSYDVQLLPRIVIVDGLKYFDMGSLKAVVRVKKAMVLVLTSSPSPIGDVANPVAFDSALAELRADLAGIVSWFRANPEAMGQNPARFGSILFNPSTLPYGAGLEAEDDGETPLNINLLQLAKRTGMLRELLRSAGYPPDLYETRIAAYEQDEVKEMLGLVPAPPPPQGMITLQDPDRLATLVRTIEQDRRTRRPDLPALRYGIFEALLNPIKTIFRSRPSGGRVWLISHLRFEVCREKYPNPYDRNQCRNWKEADPQVPRQMSGTYVFQIERGGRRESDGTRTVGQGEGETQPLVFMVP